MPGRTVTEVLQRPVPEKVPLPEGIGAAAKPGASPTDMPKLRKGVPTGMGYGQPAEILRRRLPDRVVNGVPQSAPFRRIADRGMRVLRSTPDGKTEGKTYCSRFCYLLAMDQKHVEETCEWCGEKFTDANGRGRRYCSRSCATAAQFPPRARRGSRRIPSDEAKNWRKKLTEAARACGAGKRGKRVRLSAGLPACTRAWMA